MANTLGRRRCQSLTVETKKTEERGQRIRINVTHDDQNTVKVLLERKY